MSDITLSSAVRSNLLSLQNTANLMSKTQEKLATGLKVNSAVDDPSAFFTASSLNARAGDLSRILDSVGNAIQTVKAADEGISAITKLVESAQASARSALQSAKPDNAQVEGSGASISADGNASVTGSGLNDQNDLLSSLTGGTDGSNQTETGAVVATTGLDISHVQSQTGAVIGSPGSITVGGGGTATFDVTINGTTSAGIAVNNGDSLTDVVNAINTQVNTDQGTTGVAYASIVGGNQLQVSGTDTSDNTVLVDNFAGGASSDGSEIGFDAGVTTVTNQADVTFDVTIGGETANITLSGDSEDLVDVAASINTQIQAQTSVTTDQVTLSGGGDQLVFTGLNDDDTVTINNFAGGAGADGAEIGLDSPTSVAAVAGTNDTLDITVGATTATFRIGTQNGESNTLTDLVNAINADTDINGSVKASNEGGQLKIEALNADDDFTIGGDADIAGDFGIAETTFSAENLVSQGAVQQGDTLEITIGSNPTTTITFGDQAGEVDTLDELNTALAGVTGGTASLDSDGNLSVEASTYGDDIVIGGTGSAVDLGGQAGSFGVSAGTTTEAQSSTRTTLQGQFNDLLSQIDQLAADSSFNGVNLLDGDSLEVIFNEDGTSKLDINGVTFDSAGLGVSAVTGDSFQDNANINATLDGLDDALTSLRTQSTVFGSQLSTVEIRQDFTKGLSNVLETGAANLTLADTNEEGANLLALQTRQQLSSTALSLASQADQNVLRLF